MRTLKFALCWCLCAYCLTLGTMVWAVGRDCKEDSSSKLVALQGSLSVDAANSGDWQPAVNNQIICEGARLRVEAFSRAALVLPNGVTLRLDSGTLLFLHAVAPEKPALLELVKGFVHFLSRTPKQLTITTPIVNAGPEGTEFALRVDEASAGIWVYEGGVRVFNAQGELRLLPGQHAEAEAGQAPQARIDLKPKDAVNWAIYFPAIVPALPGTEAAEIRAALAAYRHGDSREALLRLDSVPVARRTSGFYLSRAALLLVNGRVSAAKQAIAALLASQPKDAEALALRTLLALAENDKPLASELAKQALAAKPDSVAALAAASYVAQAEFDLPAALQAAEQAAALAPEDAMAWARQAELELANGLNAASEVSARRALALDASLERTQVVMGFSHLQSIELEAARKNFETAVELDSASPLARLGLGLTKIRQGNLAEGRQALEIAVSLDPNNSLLRSYLGKAYYEEKRDGLAADEFALAKQRDSLDPTPYFYDALRKQTINRPIEALDDMQAAIEKNSNRAVYRSELALDKDVSAREAGLGRIYNTLGFADLANRSAALSLYNDPTNYSAHRLLSDSYATTPRAEIARSSEYFQAQMLQPLNYNPVQPSLAYSDLNVIRNVGPSDTSFNEYKRLFERNGVRLTSTALGGSNHTYGDESALSGIANNWSYSLGQMHYASDGYRPNNGIKDNLYNAFAQTELTPLLNMQVEYRYRESKHGDLGLQGDPQTYDVTFNDRIIQNLYRYGLHFTPRQDSDLLFSFIHANRNEMQAEQGNYYNWNMAANDFEGQYIFHTDWFSALAGGGTYHARNLLTTTVDPSLQPCSYCGVSPYSSKQNFAYLYTNSRIFDALHLTLGLSYTYFHNNESGAEIQQNSLNPKLGFIWNVNEALKFRAAAFRIVKSAIIDSQTLEPLQVAGFNQFYDDTNGSISWFHGAGMDLRLGKNSYTGVELHTRDLTMPWQESANLVYNAKEELYRWYFDWKPSPMLAVNTQFKFENYRTDGTSEYFPSFTETAYVPTEIRLFAPNGFFSTLKGTYVNQKAESANNPQYLPSAYLPLNAQNGGPFAYHDSFFLLDAAVGYRFPKQYGLISLEVKNILNKQFVYQDRQFQTNDYHTPDFLPTRMLFARFTFNY